MIGKVQISLCLILHLAVVTEREKNADFLGVTREFLQSVIYRYYFCSARLLIWTILVYIREYVDLKLILGWVVVVDAIGRCGNAWWWITSMTFLASFNAASIIRRSRLAWWWTSLLELDSSLNEIVVFFLYFGISGDSKKTWAQRS